MTDGAVTGAKKMIDRDAEVIRIPETAKLDVVAEVVDNESWARMLSVLQPEGRYAYSGAIPGPVGLLDPRALYLRELILIGCTFQY